MCEYKVFREPTKEIIFKDNQCAGCGKTFSQPAMVSQFGVLLGRYCDECLDKQDRKENAIKKRQEENRRKTWLEIIGVTEEYDKATLDNYKPVSDSQKEALRAAFSILNGELDKLVLLGGNGVGKTHIAAALTKKMDGKLLTAYEMFAMYRACFTGKTTEIELIKTLSSYPLLCIDEFGRTKGSEAEDNFLSVVIDKRHSKHLPTLILSNLIRKRDCPYFDPNNTGKCTACVRHSCLETHLTMDVISRLHENARVILVEGEDYRRNGK